MILKSRNLIPIQVARSVSNLEVIARALCYGFTLPRNFKKTDLVSSTLDLGFIQGSIFMFDRIRPLNTAVLDSMTSSPLSVPLKVIDGEFFVECGDRTVPCPVLRQPQAVRDFVPGAGNIGDFLRFHSNKAIFGTPIRQCIFGAIGKPCQFCTFEMRKPKPLTPKVFASMFEKVRDGRNDVSLALGPGTPNLVDHGTAYFTKILEALHVNWHGPTSIEMVPPHNLEVLDGLIDAGVDSLIMSIELWDDSRRAEICPGKNYVSKTHYRDAWTRAIGKLGPGAVSSVLIVGLEDFKSTRVAINELVAMGVVPTLIPFRPYDNIPLKHLSPADHNEYLELSRMNVQLMNARGISPSSQAGCTECGGCSLDIETPTTFSELMR